MLTDSKAYLPPPLQAANPLVRESAAAVQRRLPEQWPAAADHLLALFPDLAPLLPAPAPAVSAVPDSAARQRVLRLKSTPLFAETPENVLATILPILHEISFPPGEQIFAKGSPGTSLFLVCEGEVGSTTARAS